MTRVGIDVDPDDRFLVRVRPDLAPAEGGLAFVDMGSVHFLLPTPRLRELHGLITAALDEVTPRPTLRCELCKAVCTPAELLAHLDVRHRDAWDPAVDMPVNDRANPAIVEVAD